MPASVGTTFEAVVVERDRCRADKLYLAKQLGYDFQPQTHRELFSHYIAYDSDKTWVEQSEIAKRLTLWPRGHFKTSSIVVEIIQCILNFPNIRVLIMQGSTKVTKNWLTEIRAHFNGDNPKSFRFRELFPEFCGENKKLKATSEHFTTPARVNNGLAQATVTVASPKSIKTGQHYDIGFFDDLVNDQNYRNPNLLEKVRQDFMMCMPLIDPPHYSYVSGTRYSFGDLYEVIMRVQKGWSVSFKICWLDENAPNEAKQPIFPQVKTDDGRIVGFTREGLLAIQEADAEMFASQYLNRPIIKGGQRFTEELMDGALIYANDAPALSEPVFFIDLASTDKDYSDDSVIIVGKQDIERKMYVVDCRGGEWLPPLLAQNIIEMTLMLRPLRIYIEKSAAGAIFVDFLRLTAMNMGNIQLPIEFIPVDVRKDAKNMRVSILQGLLRRKMLRFFHGLPRWERMKDQFLKFGGTKHDDYPDTVALMAKTFGAEAISRPMAPPPAKTIMEAMLAQDRNSMAQMLQTQSVIRDDGIDGFFAL